MNFGYRREGGFGKWRRGGSGGGREGTGGGWGVRGCRWGKEVGGRKEVVGV